jgi:hypothetical protein
MLAKFDVHHGRMMARMESQLEKMEACLGKEEATEETESKADHEDVPKEEAVVETFGAPKKWYGDWHLPIRCHSQLKKWTQGNGVSQKKLATV